MALGSSEINKYSVAAEFLAQCKDHTSRGHGSSTKIFKEDICKELLPLEAAGLYCALEMASLQLFIVDVGTCSLSPTRSNIIVRKKIRDVIEQTKEEVRSKRTFNVLCERTKEEIDKMKKEENLENEILKNQRKIEEIKLKLKGHEYAKFKEMNKKQEIIASLKDKIHEELSRNNVKLRYMDKWISGRQNQNRLRCQDAMLDLELKIEEITNRTENELRVHNEMCTFLRSEEQRLFDELDEWKEKHKQELEKREEKMKLLRTKRKEQQIVLRDLKQLFDERRKEIDEYLDFKERIYQEEEQNRRTNDMAVRLQAWWRGTMVRRGIGAFKRKKKSTKEKKKK